MPKTRAFSRKPVPGYGDSRYKAPVVEETMVMKLPQEPVVTVPPEPPVIQPEPEKVEDKLEEDKLEEDKLEEDKLEEDPQADLLLPDGMDR
jgi:hypothetical protein